MADVICRACGGALRGDIVHDHREDMTGLDDGPYLPGRAPRKKPAQKSPEEMRLIRARAWATRKREATHAG